MKNVLIVGATGMIGTELLKLCVNSNQVLSITSLVRRKGKIQSQKLKEIELNDFSNYVSIREELKDIDTVFYCLGVYTGSVPPAEFRKITVDYPLALAKELVQLNPAIVFCLLSGAGADRTEKARMMFARDKGAVENGLSAMGFKSFYAFRPAYIYPVTPRREPNFTYKLTRTLYPLIKLAGKGASIKSTELAQAMFKVGLNGASNEILENRDILNQI